ncbi:leucine-rich repeat-containing protein 23-like [Pectinophora gossypiella]|uniref:leucine-rich repeat-containing protein 23-like n=1 Tax=Pectinophora gossypiella TaxID=13191 RepID=UPI00214E85C9|nr:leucine-rich repeat-containing protein 23-like [Pectinophora gossypiella]
MLKLKVKRYRGEEDEDDYIDEQDFHEGTATTTTVGVDKDEIEPKSLVKSEISDRLSWLGKTAEGHGYAYLKATCTDMKLTEISAIKTFKYLLFVDFSQNYLTIEALQVVTEIPFLLLIKADKNKLISARLKRHKHLQVIVMSYNNISTVMDVFHPQLSTLEVGYNNIQEIKFRRPMPTLRVLDFRYNFIRELTDMDYPNLDSLYLAGNKITKLTGIDRLQNLRILHVRNNPIKYLKGFETELPKLQYLNLRNCKIATIKQIKKLREQKALETLILKGTPYMGGTGKEGPEAADEEEDAESRIEVLASLQRLQRLNKTPFTEEERQEAKDLMTQWLEEGEKDDEEEVAEEGEGEGEEEMGTEGP